MYHLLTRGLCSLLVCVLFLAVNILAYSGLYRFSSVFNKYPRRAYRLIYPWLVTYAIFNMAIIPCGRWDGHLSTILSLSML